MQDENSIPIGIIQFSYDFVFDNNVTSVKLHLYKYSARQNKNLISELDSLKISEDNQFPPKFDTTFQFFVVHRVNIMSQKILNFISIFERIIFRFFL